MAVAEAGFDRATLFVSRDYCSTSDCSTISVQFSTAGVLKEKDDFTPKVSFWYLATLRHALSGMRFAGVVEPGDVRVDAFATEAGNGAYVVWLPTSTDASMAYDLKIPGATTATQVRLKEGTATGEETVLTPENGVVHLTVGEIPLIVQVDRM
jgi:hypothetical protein